MPGTRNGDGGSVSDLGSAVGHSWRVEAKLDARFGAAVGSERVGAVGSHGDGAFSRMVRAGAVGRATSGNSRDSRSGDWFAVYRRQERALGILRRRGRSRADNDGCLRTSRD